MRTIFLGDTHGRATWKDIITKENPDRVVFIGDYFDSFDIEPAEQMFNFKEIFQLISLSFFAFTNSSLCEFSSLPLKW